MNIFVRQAEKETVYHAYDKNDTIVGTGWIIPTVPSDVYKEPRLDIYITIEVKSEDNKLAIKDRIFETLLTKGEEIKKQNDDKLVRFYHCCFSNDKENIEYYSTKPGFIHDEGMHIIRKIIENEYVKVEETSEISYVSLPLASPEEMSTLIETHKTVFRGGYTIEQIKELKQKNGWNSIAAIHNGEIVGNIMLFIEEESANNRIGWVEDLFVKKDWRNKGIARNLINRGLKHFQDCKADEVRIEVWSANERAMSLYKQFGFEFYEETEASIGKFL